MGGSKQTGQQSSSTALDPQMQAMRQQAWNAAQGWANGTPLGANQNTLDAAQNYGGYATAGNLGVRALSGDQAAYQQLANPYQQNVLDQMQNRWGQLAQNTTNQVNNAATQAGAFGGTRQGVAQGIALSQMNNDQASQMANLMNQNYANTMQQAGGLANLGMGANQQMSAIGDYLRNIQQSQDPSYHKYDVLNQAVRGMPYGQTSTQATSTPWSSKIGGGLMQGLGAAAGAGLL